MNRKYKYSEEIKERREQVMQLYEEGYSRSEIAKKLNYHYGTICQDFRFLEETEREMINRRKEQVKELYEKGCPVQEIAKQLDCHYSTVYRDIHSLEGYKEALVRDKYVKQAESNIQYKWGYRAEENEQKLS